MTSYMDSGAKKRALRALRAEASALKKLEKSVGKAFERAFDLLASRKGKIVVTGIGKSGAIAEKISATFTSLGHRAIFLHPVEALHGDLGGVSPGDAIVALSFSGESMEVIRLVRYLKKDFDVSVLALTKSGKTTLGALADAVLEVPVSEEGSPLGIAPMASVTAMLALGDMLAAALTPDGFRPGHFVRLHPGGGLALSLRKVSDAMLVGVSDTFENALRIMSLKKLGMTGVVDKRGKLSGVITDGDVRRFILSKRYGAGSSAGDAMTRGPKTIESGASLKEALEAMELHRITALFVVLKGKPVGVIHIHDIVENSTI